MKSRPRSVRDDHALDHLFHHQTPGATSVQFPAERSFWQVCSAWARVRPFTCAEKVALLPCATRTTSACPLPPAEDRAEEAALRAKFSEAKRPRLTDQPLPPPLGGGTAPARPKAEAGAAWAELISPIPLRDGAAAGA